MPASWVNDWGEMNRLSKTLTSTMGANRLAILLSVLLAMVLGWTASPLAAPAWLGKALDSVVVVRCQNGSRTLTGSGFVITDGVVATAAHLVCSGKLSVVLPSTPASTDQLSARLAHLDPVQDVALLTVGGFVPPPLPLAALPPEEGSPVWVLSAELAGEELVYKAMRGTLTETDDQGISAQLASQPGMSGAPLLAEDGTVVGMVRSGIPGLVAGASGVAALRQALRAHFSGQGRVAGIKAPITPADPQKLLPPLSEAFPTLSPPDLRGLSWQAAQGRGGYLLPWSPDLHQLTSTDQTTYRRTWRDLLLEPQSPLLPQVAVEVVRSPLELDEFARGYASRFLWERGWVEMDWDKFDGLYASFILVVGGRAREGLFYERVVAFAQTAGGEKFMLIFTFPWFAETSPQVAAFIATTLGSFKPPAG